MAHVGNAIDRTGVSVNPTASIANKGFIVSDYTQHFIDSLPHSKSLGMQIESVDQDLVRLALPYDVRFVGDALTGVIHGGAVSALIDTCCGAAVVAKANGQIVTATLDLRIDYMRSAQAQQTIVAEATCYHMARSVAFVRATAFDNDTSNPVATASGTFTITRINGGAE